MAYACRAFHYLREVSLYCCHEWKCYWKYLHLIKFLFVAAVGNICHCQSCPHDVTARVFLWWSFRRFYRLRYAAESWRQLSDIPVQISEAWTLQAAGTFVIQILW